MLKSPNILVIGDRIIDEYIYGECRRISPEAPVPVVSFGRSVIVEGGASNVVENLKALGASVKFWCGHKASHKQRILAGHQQVVRLDRDDLAEVAIPAQMEEWVRDCDAILISDYNKGIVNQPLIDRIESLRTQYARPLLVDPYNGRFNYGRAVTLIKPNRTEAESIVGMSINGTGSLLRVGQRYLERTRADNCVITLGAEGMVLFDRHQLWDEPFKISTTAQQVFDVTGAGDTAIAVLAYLMASRGDGFQFSKKSAVKYANRAAGMVCAKLGTATVSHDELFGTIIRED